MPYGLSCSRQTIAHEINGQENLKLITPVHEFHLFENLLKMKRRSRGLEHIANCFLNIVKHGTVRAALKCASVTKTNTEMHGRRRFHSFYNYPLNGVDFVRACRISRGNRSCCPPNSSRHRSMTGGLVNGVLSSRTVLFETAWLVRRVRTA